MEYLKRVLGINTVYTAKKLPSMPNYINERYTLKPVRLDGVNTVFVYPYDDSETVNAIKKHLAKIESITDSRAVIVTDSMTYRRKEYFLREHIPFIVDCKQIYLPFMAVYLQERGDVEQEHREKLFPSAQVLLFHYIYNGCRELSLTDAANALSFSANSVSKASRQLESLGLIKMKNHGVSKYISTYSNPEKLFEMAKPYLVNPVKRTVFIKKSLLKEKLHESGYEALCEYSMLSVLPVKYYASDSIAKWEKQSSIRMNSTSEECAIEFWRYDPGKLSKGNYVDKLSLALVFDDNEDERTQMAVEEMLESVWKDTKK